MTSNLLTKAELDQIVPTEMRYRHNPIGKVLYTEGVRYLADKGEAEWLITQIAFAQTHRNVAAEDFQRWRLLVKLETGSAVLECFSDKDQLVFSRTIEYTEFPIEETLLYVVANVMMLPSER